MGLLARGMDWLADKTATAGGVSVTYTRANASATLTATPGDQQMNALRLGQVQQATSNWTEREYLIAAAALAAAGFTGPPAIGDRITETVGGEAVTFEAMRRDGGQQCWKWSEPERLTYRVHTKRVG